MYNAMYVAASGALAVEKKLDAITNNLANINTTGFKADNVLFESYLKKGVAETMTSAEKGRLSEYVVADEVYTDFSEGTSRETGNPLDLALHGDGFFSVMTFEGERYTRAGNFRVGGSGELTTAEGHTVLNEHDRPIYVGDGVAHVDEEGNVWVRGSSMADPGEGDHSAQHGVFMGRLKIVDFEKPYPLTKTGQGLMAALPNNVAYQAENIEIRQGFLETSNVNMIGQMTEMIKAQRAFESYQKAIRESDSMTGTLLSRVGR